MSDDLTKAYARILAIRDEAQADYIPAALCEEHDQLIQLIAGSTGDDLSGFTIGELGKSGNGKMHYSNYVRPKIQGYLNYLSLKVTHPPEDQIGFR